MQKIKLAIADDHKMVSKAIENMISSNGKMKVIINANNGEKLMEEIKTAEVKPDIVLMDINMPFKNGIEATQEISENYPEIRVIALTMEDNENVIIKMLRAGAKGYLLKDMTPDILFKAIETVYEKGVFYTDVMTQSLLRIKSEDKAVKNLLSELKEKELEFIRHACTEMTYREIAELMGLSPKTIDGYRDSVFAKIDVKSRVGIVLFAMKNGLC
ncbi:response regulator [Daejeonia sp. YH14]|uniref:response regulator n=1 Tax=Daejeonia sp. YH14 TaxID=3439042 RepID=UPI003F490F16